MFRIFKSYPRSRYKLLKTNQMKAFTTLVIIALSTFCHSQEYKWDVGVKYERDNLSWLQIEGRYHINENIAIIGQLSGSRYQSSYFRPAGLNLSDSTYYYSNTLNYGDLAKFNTGFQYTLPFKKKFLYTGLTVGAGYSRRSSHHTYYVSPDPDNISLGEELPPDQSIVYGYAIFLETPENYSVRTKTMFLTTDLHIGTDLTLTKRLLFTASLSGGVRAQANYFTFNFAFASGLRYQLGKTS